MVNADSYVTKFITVLLVAVLVGSTATLLLGYVANLTTTFSATGIGALFGTAIFGLIFAIGVFVALYKMIKM